MSDWETVTPQRRESDGWETIAGGAAVGNPQIQRQGERSRRTTTGEAAGTIAGAGVLGGIAGVMAPEILTGLGGAAASFPATAPAAPFLMGAGSMLKGQRLMSGAAGLVGGLVGETAGQAVEQAGGSPIAAEGARIVGGGIAPEAGPFAGLIARKTMGVTGLSEIPNILRKLAGKETKLSDAERQYLQEQLTALRGGDKTNAPLEATGNVMGAEADRLNTQGAAALSAANQQQANVGRFPAADREFADIGGDLRGIIAPRFEAAKVARAAEYTRNEAARDAIVKAREGAGQFVNKTPEYQTIVSELESQLAPGVRSKSVQDGVKKILSDIQSAGFKDGEESLVLNGRNLDLVKGQPQQRDMSFQALDDVRRKLGDVFKGKPAEGYDAISADMAKDLYAKISAVQKNYAGGENGPQAKLLQDYANSSDALAMFRSKTGKRATALDMYNDAEYATDASKLPAAYFKTRAGVNQLRELTGNPAAVDKAAMEYANKEIRALDSSEKIGSWMNRNSEFLQSVPKVRAEVSSYLTKVKAAEASTRNAQEFAASVAKDASLLTRQSLPAQRAVDLIKSGDTELWGKIAPAVMASPQAKQQLVAATRQVLADQATAKDTVNLFSRNIRPFLENANIASKGELDFIAQKLANIQEMKVPEPEKLGVAKRILLQASGSWGASAASRTGNYVSREYLIPAYDSYMAATRPPESEQVKKIPR